MEKGFGQAHPEVIDYVHELLCPEDEMLKSVREECIRRGLPTIQVGSFDGRHLEVLVRMMGATKAVEIGTLGGYSGISICRGMGPAGKLHTFERDPHHAEVARQSFERAGVANQVQIHIGPAVENLPSISKFAPFDIVFIDADKAGYPRYLQWATDNLRMGGAVVADNTFAWGLIHKTHGLSPQEHSSIDALRQFNDMVANSGRYRATILPTSEGLTVGVKVN